MSEENSNSKLGGCAGTRYGCCPDGKTSKRDPEGSNCPGVVVRKYDQIVRGNVKITSKCNGTYKIKFNKISDFLVYQIWSDKIPNYNNNRRVSVVKAVDWVNQDFPNPPLNPPFQPTTIIELDFSNRYVVVITDAKIKNDKVVFYVSTGPIDLVNPTCNMRLLKKIPIGSFLNVRFDIDFNLSGNITPCKYSRPTISSLFISGYDSSKYDWYLDSPMFGYTLSFVGDTPNNYSYFDLSVINTKNVINPQGITSGSVLILFECISSSAYISTST